MIGSESPRKALATVIDVALIRLFGSAIVCDRSAAKRGSMKTPGAALEFQGSISLTDVPETFLVTPVSLKPAGEAQ